MSDFDVEELTANGIVPPTEVNVIFDRLESIRRNALAEGA